MSSIVFIDVEVGQGHNIEDIGAIRSSGEEIHTKSLTSFRKFIAHDQFLCGHNIVRHDILHLSRQINDIDFNSFIQIDTLYWAPLLFPKKPYHALVKDDKVLGDECNNPLNDAKKARDLFNEELTAFQKLNPDLQKLFYKLLNNVRGFDGLFKFLDFKSNGKSTDELISHVFQNQICADAPVKKLIEENPIELAYSLAIINCHDPESITPRWVTLSYPGVERVMHLLRNKPCLAGCAYCDDKLDAKKALKHYFQFDDFRKHDGKPLQEQAAKAAIDNKSMLAIFPTGGGKSITFQVPALIAGESMKGLTIVISPLQSLMKDQVDNLEAKGITTAVTINGLLDPIERAKSFQRVDDGSAFLLYISPESLRSKSIERVILGRKIARVVIDEAHCLSTWGQDFRVDYLYIAEFIRNIQTKKNLTDPIPVSCFTATAKPQVVDDICNYFLNELDLDLEKFIAKSVRENLKYGVHPKEDDKEKYNSLRLILEERKEYPTIVYVSRTSKADKLAESLKDDGFDAISYHGKMEAKEKTANQNAFMKGESKIIVATSAFGMGVDKKDIMRVIHYDISDSLENYVQEAGRAGRDDKLTAECFILYNDEDLHKHFILLNQTKLSIAEIKQVWRAIKKITRAKASMQNSAFEIARESGWDENIQQIETRVTSAIAALEDAGYLKRGQNMPRVYATSILSRSNLEASEKIMASSKFSSERERLNAKRIMASLFSRKKRMEAENGEAEHRVDYLSDRLGILRQDVIRIINILKEEGILADTKDLTAFFNKGDQKQRSIDTVSFFVRIENFLFNCLDEEWEKINLKEIIESGIKEGLNDLTTRHLKTILNFWSIQQYIKISYRKSSKNDVFLQFKESPKAIRQKLDDRHAISASVIKYLQDKAGEEQYAGKEEVLLEFSIIELKEAVERENQIGRNVTPETIEDVLFFLSRIGAITIEGGFLVIYNKLFVERVEQNLKKQYTEEDYKKLKHYYDNRVQQIHIVGEYAERMIQDYKEALLFVDDYFQLNYSEFIRKYFPGSRAGEIKRTITRSKYKELFGDLSDVQRAIIDDKTSKTIVVAAGPGSGKTKVLVHKLASLLLMEDVKQEQMLMLTFSRAAATEFKSRLLKLIGNAALYVEIKTFHSYCFDLMGRVGSITKSGAIIREAINAIRSGQIEQSRITKTVLVIDEAQDMDKMEFELVKLLREKNETMRIIAVGDDDQHIYGFRGSDPKYFQQLVIGEESKTYELLENYRARKNLVAFTNRFAGLIQSRLKINPIVSKSNENGSIHVTRYRTKHLITPFLEDIIKAELKGTTGVLTHTNQEAAQITGLLIKNGIKARLIQSNDGFDLIQLFEIRMFLSLLSRKEKPIIIVKEEWKKAKDTLKETCKESSRLKLCLKILQTFEKLHPKTMYYSDLTTFLRESLVEDFVQPDKETILVSTMHKAKGREFDNVFLLLNDYPLLTDDEIRPVYVAMTRAKSMLRVHHNGSFPDLSAEIQYEHNKDHKAYEEPSQIVLYLTHKDVQLGYFDNLQHQVSLLRSGESLIPNETGCLNHGRQRVVKFSNAFQERYNKLMAEGYRAIEACVNYMVYWEDEEKGKEVIVVLPRIELQNEVNF